jgi:hypothetical protein
MSEWEDITIVRQDKERSQPPTADDVELTKQVLVLSALPPPRWAEICTAALGGTPGRLGRMAEVQGQNLVVWGGPKIFDERDAEHLKKLIGYANTTYREILEPVNLSGLDAFGQ